MTSWCSTSDNTEYIHYGCYYEVHKCATPPYYIENHRPNTSIFEICFNFTSTREWKSFGIQTLQQTECISGPHFHQPLNPTCFKSGNCSADRGNLTLYSYDVYVMKGNVSVFASPSFTKKPNSTVALEGSQVTFLCNATGSPMPTILWYKDGLELPGSTSRYQILNDNSTLTIKKADRTDEGRYSCNVSNSIGPGLSSSANLTVNYLPKILVSPNDATSVEKANVTLMCYLEGKPRATVSWFKDGTPIPTNDARIYLSPPTSVSNTSTTITITIVNRTDEGNYSCRAVNDAGNDTSSAAFLTVNYKPKVLQSPESLTRNENKSVILSCKFEGKPLPSVTWRKNGREIQTSSNSRISTSVSRSNQDNYSGRAKLEISRLTREDQGHFSCYIQSKISGDLSEVGALEITYLPFILSSPHDITKNESDQVQLSCSMEGNPKPTVSWHKNGRIINPDGRTTFQIKGNASRWKSTVTIKSIKSTDSGSYGCVATNAATVEKVRSKTGRLVVNVKPEIQHKPRDATVIQGEQASFYCNATGVPEPVISWRYSGGSTPQHIGNKLLIDNVRNTEEYEGKYTCIASSRAGKTEESATLTVLVPPTMKTALTQGKVLQLGQTLRLKCDIYGDPEPSFSWTKRLPRKEEKILLPNQKKYLEIPDVRVKNAAFYGCTAKNKIGSITLDEVFVDVNTSLDIINSGQTFNAIEGSSTTIKCLASSEIPPKEVTLFKDGTRLKTETYISKDEQVMTATLDLTKVTTNDSGTYTCVARNRQKKARANVTLTVYVPFKVDMDVSLKNKTFTRELYDNSTEEYRNLTAEFIREITKVYENEAGFIRVEVLGFSNGSVSVQFRVVYRIKVENPEEKPPSDTKVRIANVLVRRVKRTDGIVGNLVLKAESLKPRVTPPSPRNLTAINIKKTSLTIHWRPPLYYDHYSVEKYIIKCKEFAGSWKNLEALGKHLDTFYFDDLEPETSYSIQACAVNRVGEGIPSETIEIKTLSDIRSKFTKILVPIFLMLLLLLIGVIVLLYIRRQRTRREIKLIAEIEGKRFYHEFPEGGKKLEFVDAMEMVELPVRCRLIPRENLELGQELGSGQFGVVHKGFVKEKGEDEDGPCAVKMLKPGASESDYRDLFSELEIMCSVDEHPNIINLLGACRGGGGAPLYVVVEFAENGCLLDYLRENRTTTLDEDGNEDEVSSLQNKEKIRIALDIAKGMAHLASHKCVHRDLAARNVLLGKDRVAKVADFGLARDVYEQGFYEKSSSGGKLPAKWMSIEALETLKATSESDVWSFGVLMWEIETAGKIPYAGLDYMELLKALKSGVRLQKPRNCSEELYSIMKDCWEANPEKRPKFKVLSLVLDNHLMAFVDNKC